MVDSKIIWQFVCRHFNLQLNEAFKIDGMRHSLRYRITQNGLEVYDELEERWKENGVTALTALVFMLSETVFGQKKKHLVMCIPLNRKYKKTTC